MNCVRTSALLVLLSAFLIQTTTGQSSTLSQIGISANSHPVDAGKVQVDVHLTNGTKKTITAWAWSTEIRFSDGSLMSHSGVVDVLNELLTPDQNPMVSTRTPYKDIAFRPETDRTFQDFVSTAGHTDAPIQTTAKVTAVVFDDDTAIGDSVRIGRLAASRRSQAALAAEEIAEIDKALAASSPREGLKAALANRHPNNAGGGMLRQILSQLDNNAPVESVRLAESSFRAYQALLAKHSTLEVHI